MPNMMLPRAGKIRPPRRPIIGRLDSPNDDFEPSWQLLRDALTDIHEKNAGRLSFEQLYRASYKIVIRKKGQDLYDRVKAFEEQWFADHVMPQIQNLLSKNLVSVSLLQAPGFSANERRQMGERFLRGVRVSWEDHNMSMNMIADILMYLDRTYTQDSGRPSTWAANIGLFRDNILRSGLGGLADGPSEGSNIFDVLIAVILDLINMERDGDVIDKTLLRSVTYMLEVLYETDEEIENQKLYLTVFEPRFLAASRDFYQKECQKMMRESNASTWLRHTQRRLNEEKERCDTTLSSSTSDNIASVVEDELIKAHLDEFLAMEGSGLKNMIDNDRFEDLSIAYQLVERVDKKKETLKTMIQAQVMALGLEIEQTLKSTDFSIPAAAANGDGDDAANEGAEKKQQTLSASAQQTAAAIKWVDEVLQLKDKFDRQWIECFDKDLILQSAITKSFSDFINRFSSSSEYIALFIDDNLRKGIKGKTEAEVDVILEKAIVLMRYVQSRDLFERYYQKHLSRRLLHGKSESQDVEKEMISRMKQEMGNSFTAKFEGMFKDMEVSRELTQNYRGFAQPLWDDENAEGRKFIDLGIYVLTTNNWPPDIMNRQAQQDKKGKEDKTVNSDVIYPPEIKRLQDSFLQFYSKDRSGRVLTWLATAGNADIKCTFPKIAGKESGPLSKERRYELNVGNHGMLVLLLFNDLAPAEWLSFEEIQAKTNIPAPDLRRTLTVLSLAPRSRVLLKNPPTKAVNPEDHFSFNESFVSKTFRIKLPTMSSVPRVEGEEERKETEQRNDQTRAHVVDAAIVRTMKQRKKLGHPNLVTEVITQLAGRFRPEVSLVKRRIEDLLAREYLDRDDETGAYVYLA